MSVALVLLVVSAQMIFAIPSGNITEHENLKLTTEAFNRAPRAISSPMLMQNLAEQSVRSETASKGDLITPSFGIMLALISSQMEGVQVWRALALQHRDLLGILKPRLFEAAHTRSRTIYGLMAGPFETNRAAKEVCNRLIARGLDCTVTEFRGITPAVGGPVLYDRALAGVPPPGILLPGLGPS
ncbi:hypothetical protein [Rhodoligotrophos ferricapiens]|uniref:hypothetical protein n=1 Tax=Rhodoligotrophos ferricapiens TaxID=3069264 RepID=UPI00315DA2E2